MGLTTAQLPLLVVLRPLVEGWDITVVAVETAVGVVVVGEEASKLPNMPTDIINSCLPLNMPTFGNLTAVGLQLLPVSTHISFQVSQEPTLVRTPLCTTLLVFQGCTTRDSPWLVLIIPTLCHTTGGTIIHL